MGYSELSVIFRGDGEPKTIRGMLQKLTEFDEEVGIEVDNYSLGGTVERLEKMFAEKLGKEAAVFMPTGTLANHVAIRKHCVLRPRAVVQEQSHIYNDCGDCVAQLSGVNLVPLAKGRPYFTLEELKEEFTRSEAGRVSNPIGAVIIESPVRRQAGQVVPFEEMRKITEFSRGKGVLTHLDGARLYIMSSATGVQPRQYTTLFDTAYVSLYKYFGAPFGAILAGRSEFIGDLCHVRRMFGGGLSSVCLAAALALKGCVDFEEKLTAAMKKAAELFDRINTIEGVKVGRYEHGSNIFPMDLGSNVNIDKFISALRDHEVFVYPDEDNPKHIHLTVNPTILRRSNDDIFSAFTDALNRSR